MQCKMASVPRGIQHPRQIAPNQTTCKVATLNVPSRRAGSRLTMCHAAAKVKFSSFQELLDQAEFVLVDFYATWCGPCHMMSEIMEDTSKAMQNVKFAKVDTERYPTIASQYGVQALPTLVLFRNGKPIRRVEGVLTRAQLQQWVNQASHASPAAS